MGGGSWTRKDFETYSSSRGRTVDSLCGAVVDNLSAQEMFTSRRIDEALNPRNVIRECCDSEEHPNTKPVILGIDVTGSMGSAAVEVAKKIGVVMTKLFDKVPDVEFMIMGIGDLSYDTAPIQASQFESDIRIAEQLDKLFFEGGGGGNDFESYTAAWYFGSRHTKLDCWNRGKKGIIITMGDEPLNPYLPLQGRHCGLRDSTGDTLQGDVETKDLYREASEKFDIYHLNVQHGHDWRQKEIETSFRKYLDENHYSNVNLNSIADKVISIIMNAFSDGETEPVNENSFNNGMISW